MAEPGRRRIGIRSLLLVLLLPALTALLALDAWRDHRLLARAVIEAHDQILIEPVQALSQSLRLGADGQPQLAPSFSVQSMFGATGANQQQLRVVTVPVSPPGPERSLLGSAELPPPPPGPDDQPVFYDASWQGQPLRIAALRRTLGGSDGPDRAEGQRWHVLIQAAEGTGARERLLTESWRRALRNDALTLLLMAALVWLGISLSLRPLERLRRSLAARAAGDLAPLDAAEVPHEVAPLVEAINRHMASQSRMLEEQRRFLADASHQLRTPLAIMLTQAGYALREREPEPMRETLRAIAGQLVRARRLSEQLLALAHSGEAAPANDADLLADLNAVAREVVLQYLPLAHEKQLDLGWVDARGEAAEGNDADEDAPLSTTAGPSPSTPSDPSAMGAPVAAAATELHEALANLVHNAIKYTPAGGQVTVAVRRLDASCEAEVCDTGPGIAPERRSRVFERFGRADALPTGHPAGTADTADTAPGAGLGLAIARAYARRNGGVVELGDAPAVDGRPGGLRAVLRLPLLGSNPISDNTYFAEPPPR